MEQTYPGFEDHKRHFHRLLPAFCDERYITVDGKCLFLIYMPPEIPDPHGTTDLWREMAANAGLKGLFLVGVRFSNKWSPQDCGLDAVVTTCLPPLRLWISRRNPIKWAVKHYERWSGKPTIYLYEEIVPYLLCRNTPAEKNYPCVIPNWDNTPRSGANGVVLHCSTPELFRVHFRDALKVVEDAPAEHRLIFIKSWNEWAEGNHLEPDLRYGRGYLQVIHEELTRFAPIHKEAEDPQRPPASLDGVLR